MRFSGTKYIDIVVQCSSISWIFHLPKWKLSMLAKSLQLCVFVTLRAIAHQVPLSMGFSRQEYWSGLPFPPPGDLPDSGIKPASLMSPALVDMLQEGGPLPGPETGLLSNTRKWVVRGDTCADKARDFIGKGHPGGEQEGKGTQENCSAPWLAVLGFMVMELVSRWSLGNQSNSESFLVAHALLSQDGC